MRSTALRILLGGLLVTFAANARAQGTPYHGTPIQIPGKVEAEDFNLGGEGVAYHDTDTVNQGGAYRPSEGVDIATTWDAGNGYNVGWVAPGEWMYYTINASAAGTYTLSARVASSGAGGTFHIEIDGVNVSGAMAVPDTGGWTNWRTIFKPGVSLAAGQHVMKFVADSVGPSGAWGGVDYFALTISSPFYGTPIAVPGTVQAEDFDNGGSLAAYFDNTPGNIGGAYRAEDVDIAATSDTTGVYNVGWIEAGEWLSYTLNVQEAGVYTVGIRLSHPGQGGVFHLELDGVNVTGPIQVPDTGGWNSWQTITKSAGRWSVGRHVLYFVADSVSPVTGAVANVNYFVLTDPPICDPATYGANPNGGDSWSAIQQCLNGGGTVVLASGQPGYVISQTLQIKSPGTILTDNGGGGTPVLLADPSLGVANPSPRGRQILIANGVDNFTISNITLDGNKDNRRSDLCGQKDYGDYGKTMMLKGNGWKMMNVTVKNAVCGSNAEVQGSNYEIANSTFSDGGYPALDPRGDGRWADGLTVWSCNSGRIHDNKLFNNTDIDLVSGGGNGCIVEHNHIWNDPNRHAFAGLHVGWFPFPAGGGNHSGNVYRINDITSTGPNGLAFGLAVGFEPWWFIGVNPGGNDYDAFTSDAGSVINNSIVGAVVNLVVEGIGNGYIADNTTSGATGTQGFPQGCNISAAYSAHFYGRATIQPGWFALLVFPWWMRNVEHFIAEAR